MYKVWTDRIRIKHMLRNQRIMVQGQWGSRWVALTTDIWPWSSLSSGFLGGNVPPHCLSHFLLASWGLSASSNHKQKSKESPIWKMPQEKNNYLNSAGVEKSKNNAFLMRNPLFLSLYFCTVAAEQGSIS